MAAPESVNLNFVAAWIQIHKLPIGYRNKPLITNLVEKKVGKVIEVENDVQGVGNFVRARVKLDVREVLPRVVSLSRAGQREVYHIRYEKIPKCCGACGMLGHTQLECGTGEHDKEKLKWGDFLKADWEPWHGRRTFAPRGDQANRGRGPSSGRGDTIVGRGEIPQSWRFNANPTYNSNKLKEDLWKDASPLKNIDTEISEKTESDFKRRLLIGNGGEEGIQPLNMLIKMRSLLAKRV